MIVVYIFLANFITFKFVKILKKCQQSIYSAGPRYLQPCFTCVADMQSRRRLCSSCSDCLHSTHAARLSLYCRQSHVYSFSPLQYGTICRFTSYLHRHLRSLDSASRHSCSCALILTFSFNPFCPVFF